MTDDQRKALTLYLGECWHEQDVMQKKKSLYWYCKHCGNDLYIYSGEDIPHRSFTTWNDLGALKDKLVEKGDWKRFLGFAFNSEEGCNTDITCTYDEDAPDDRFYNEDFISWLINPTRFCELVAEWLERRKRNEVTNDII